MEADKDTIIKAVKAISKTLEQNNIPQLEGGIAMLSILNNLKEQGLDIRSEPNLN